MCLLLKSLFCLKLEYCRSHTVAGHRLKCEVINDVKLFQIVSYCGYTVANFEHYPMRHDVVLVSASKNVSHYIG